MIDKDQFRDKVNSVRKIRKWYVSKGELPGKNNKNLR